MPGRTPADAVAAFLRPFAEGIKLLDGYAKIVVMPRPPYRKGIRYGWSLNGESGMTLPQTGTFYASMTFEVVDSIPAEHDEGAPGSVPLLHPRLQLQVVDPEGRRPVAHTLASRRSQPGEGASPPHASRPRKAPAHRQVYLRARGRLAGGVRRPSPLRHG